jgi:fused signal recognition particle receptor
LNKQNSFAATEVSCLAVTKLDGTAAKWRCDWDQINFKSVKYIGVGEGIEDLQVFNKYEFVVF